MRVRTLRNTGCSHEFAITSLLGNDHSALVAEDPWKMGVWTYQEMDSGHTSAHLNETRRTTLGIKRLSCPSVSLSRR